MIYIKSIKFRSYYLLSRMIDETISYLCKLATCRGYTTSDLENARNEGYTEEEMNAAVNAKLN